MLLRESLKNSPSVPKNELWSVEMVPLLIQLSIQNSWLPALRKKTRPGSTTIVERLVKLRVLRESNGRTVSVVTLNAARFTQATASIFVCCGGELNGELLMKIGNV